MISKTKIVVFTSEKGENQSKEIIDRLNSMWIQHSVFEINDPELSFWLSEFS